VDFKIKILNSIFQ